ncbi:MAG: hypothetical protein ABI791_09280 [Acidobacteriota bacterium]
MSQKNDAAGTDVRQNLDAITEEASQADSDDTIRRARRGDESKGDPNERDVAGGPRHADTPHGREEAKNDRPSKDNTNG